MGRIRFQVLLALIAIVLLVLAMAYLAFSSTTVTVPDHGGTYVEGVAGNPQMINPILSQANPVDQDLVSLIFSGLTRASEKGEIIPDLAERWEISQDGRVYTFYLRRDVSWHDGAPFVAADVVFTINAIKSPDYQGVPFLADLWQTVVVESLDDYTVRCTLREPFAPFLDYTTMGILPAHVLEGVPIAQLGTSQFNAAPIGTGPFQVSEISLHRLVLIPNNAFYRIHPYLERIEFRFYPNDPSVFEARKRQEVTGIARVLPENLQDVRQDSTLTLYSASLAAYNLVFLNLDRAIFQERAVRQAMMWALDRQKLVSDIRQGQGIVIHSPILPNSWAYDPNVIKYRQDQHKARTLLEEAGWLDNNNDGIRERGTLKLEFTLATNEDDPVRVRMIQAISQQLAEVGIRAIPTPVNWEQLARQMLALRRFDAVLSGWQDLPPDPDPYSYWHSSQAQEDGLNFASYIDEEVDALLQEARATNDTKRRQELYHRFQEIFARDVPALLLYQPVYNYAVDASVKGVQIGPLLSSADRFRTLPYWYIATQRMLSSEAREKGLDTR